MQYHRVDYKALRDFCIAAFQGYHLLWRKAKGSPMFYWTRIFPALSLTVYSG